jgi:hypothetical protein
LKEAGLKYLRGSFAAATFCVLACVSQGDSYAASEITRTENAELTFSIPPTQPRPEPASGLNQAKTDILEFVTGPFPYDGTVPGSGKPFLDVEVEGKRGRQAAGGRVYWEDDTYTDQRVLLHIPERFNVRRPGVLIVFFHGHGAKIERDIRDRQQLPAQISESHANAVLVAPQFAVDAADSSAGNFWEPGSFARFLREAARHLARLNGDPRTEQIFAKMPVVIVSYSGGYLPLAWVLQQNEVKGRLRGVVLLDALYGELDKFEDWIANNRSAFFISAYLGSTRNQNIELQRILSERNIEITNSLDQQLRPGTVAFLPGNAEEETHRDFVTQAWAADPIADILNRLPEYRR